MTKQQQCNSIKFSYSDNSLINVSYAISSFDTLLKLNN